MQVALLGGRQDTRDGGHSGQSTARRTTRLARRWPEICAFRSSRPVGANRRPQSASGRHADAVWANDANTVLQPNGAAGPRAGWCRLLLTAGRRQPRPLRRELRAARRRQRGRGRRGRRRPAEGEAKRQPAVLRLAAGAGAGPRGRSDAGPRLSLRAGRVSRRPPALPAGAVGARRGRGRGHSPSSSCLMVNPKCTSPACFPLRATISSPRRASRCRASSSPSPPTPWDTTLPDLSVV